MSIRVVTLNLWGRGDAWDDRRPVLADGLRKLGAELLAFQEAVGPTATSWNASSRRWRPRGSSRSWPAGAACTWCWPATSTPTPTRPSVRFWRGRQSLGGMSVAYRNAWEAIHPDDPGHTFTPSNPLVPSRSNPMVVDGERVLEVGRRIGHIMVRCGHHGPTLDVVACERIFDEPVDGVWASDHFGVMADLEVPD